MPVVSAEQMSKLKEIQASLPWIKDGTTDDTYRQTGAEIREKLTPYMADIEGFFVGAKHDYIATFAILVGLDKLTFMKWAADERFLLPLASTPPPGHRRAGRPRTAKQAPPEEAEQRRPVVELVPSSDPDTSVQSEESVKPPEPSTQPEDIPSEGGRTIRKSLVEAGVPLRAQMEELGRYRDSVVALEKHYASVRAKTEKILEKYEELITLLNEYIEITPDEDAGTSI